MKEQLLDVIGHMINEDSQFFDILKSKFEQA